jgi:hypothetical protein
VISASTPCSVTTVPIVTVIQAASKAIQTALAPTKGAGLHLHLSNLGQICVRIGTVVTSIVQPRPASKVLSDWLEAKAARI